MLKDSFHMNLAAAPSAMELAEIKALKQLPLRMTDAELIALAALANVEAVLMAGDNANRAGLGMPTMWSSGCGYMEFGTKLAEEIYRREKERAHA